MVADMSRTKKACAQHEPTLSAAIGKLSTLREELKAAMLKTIPAVVSRRGAY